MKLKIHLSLVKPQNCQMLEILKSHKITKHQKQKELPTKYFKMLIKTCNAKLIHNGIGLTSRWQTHLNN